jgi:hypothetical protein
MSGNAVAGASLFTHPIEAPSPDTQQRTVGAGQGVLATNTVPPDRQFKTFSSNRAAKDAEPSSILTQQYSEHISRQMFLAQAQPLNPGGTVSEPVNLDLDLGNYSNHAGDLGVIDSVSLQNSGWPNSTSTADNTLPTFKLEPSPGSVSLPPSFVSGVRFNILTGTGELFDSRIFSNSATSPVGTIKTWVRGDSVQTSALLRDGLQEQQPNFAFSPNQVRLGWFPVDIKAGDLQFALGGEFRALSNQSYLYGGKFGVQIGTTDFVRFEATAGNNVAPQLLSGDPGGKTTPFYELALQGKVGSTFNGILVYRDIADTSRVFEGKLSFGVGKNTDIGVYGLAVTPAGKPTTTQVLLNVGRTDVLGLDRIELGIGPSFVNGNYDGLVGRINIRW